MVGLALGLSLFGFYQYFETIPADQAEFERIKDDPQRVFEQIGHWYAPGTPERAQFENRLKSSEPFASYSLTNSLAGFLATWLVMLLGVGLCGMDRGSTSHRGRPPSARPSLIGRACTLALPIVGCLLLTKSRSGYLATMAGMAMLWLFCRGLVWRGARTMSRRTLAMTGAATMLVLSGLIGLATFTGGVDRAVLTGASKSLGYRWQYWQSSLAMIRDHLWFGCGPGQFQNAYTAYKLPHASEEINDPHNFLVEIWATAGTPAMVAMALVVAMLLWRLWMSAFAEYDASVAEHDRGEVAEPDDRRTIGFISSGAALGVLLGILVRPLVGFPLDLAALMICLFGLVLTLMLLRGWAQRGAMASALPAIGAVVLLVNLLAAGGIGSVGVAGSFWLLLALSFNIAQKGTSTHEFTRRAAWIALAVAACLTVAFYCTGYRPVLNSRSLIERAGAGRMSDRESTLIMACEADPLSFDAARLLVGERFARWQRDTDADSLGQFEQSQRSMLRLAPQSRSAWAQSGRWWSEIFDTTQDPTHLDAAIGAHRRTADLYPHSAHVLAELAGVLAKSNRQAEALSAAEAALHQDDITRQAGHTDKLLPDELRRQLVGLTDRPDR